MCHPVKTNARALRRRRAYKVVYKVRGKYASVHATSYVSRRVFWAPGRVVRAVGSVFVDENRLSEAGIYVFCSLADARFHAVSFNRVIIQVEVDPADWLTTSVCGKFATYRKAKMTKVVKSYGP